MRMNGKINRFLTCLIGVIILLITIRIINLLDKAGLFFVPYLSETLAIFISLSLLAAMLCFLAQVKEKTDFRRRKKQRNSFSSTPRRIEKKRIPRQPKIRKIKKDKTHHIEREKAQLKKYIK